MNLSEIIGVPIKIGDIEVAQFDFPNQMDWHTAVKTTSVCCTKIRIEPN